MDQHLAPDIGKFRRSCQPGKIPRRSDGKDRIGEKRLGPAIPPVASPPENGAIIRGFRRFDQRAFGL